MKGLLLSKKSFQNSHNMNQEEHGTSISKIGLFQY